MKPKQILIHYELKKISQEKESKDKEVENERKKIRGIVQEINRIIRLS